MSDYARIRIERKMTLLEKENKKLREALNRAHHNLALLRYEHHKGEMELKPQHFNELLTRAWV